MASSLSAPVGDKSRKPDPKAKVKQGAVANKKDDVELVQLMLNACGISVKISGSADAATIKGINTLEKQAGDKPDGVIDPGDGTWKKFVGKLDAQIAADQKTLDGLVCVIENGRETWVSRKKFDDEEQAARKAMQRRAESFMDSAQSWLDFAKEANDAMLGAKGFMNSMTEFFVQWKDADAEPPMTKFLDAYYEAKLLVSFAKSDRVEWKKLVDQDKKAVKAHNDGIKAMQKWTAARIGSAQSIVDGLTLVQDVSFAIVEVYATAQIALKVKNPVTANAIASGSVATLKATAGQIGEALADNKIDGWKAAKKIVSETLWASTTGAVGGKLTKAFSGALHKPLLEALTKRFAHPAVTQRLGPALEKLMSTAYFQELVTSLAKESIGVMKSGFDKGKIPDGKEFEDALLKSVLAGVLKIPIFDKVAEVQRDAPKKAADWLGKMLPSRLDKLKATLTKEHGAKFAESFLKANGDVVQAEIWKANNGKLIEAMMIGAIDSLRDAPDPKGVEKAAMAALEKQSDLDKQIEAITLRKAKEEAKKQGVSAK